MHVKSFGNSQYYATFIDDYSRYVYFPKSKYEVLEKFEEFAIVSYVSTLGKKVKVLRSDNGG